MAPDLTKSKDLLSEPRVIAAAEGLEVSLIVQSVPHNYKWAKPIEVIAFEIRDACNSEDYPYIKMLDKVFAEMLYHSPSHAWATAEEMVIAATWAWEAGQ